MYLDELISSVLGHFVQATNYRCFWLADQVNIILWTRAKTRFHGSIPCRILCPDAPQGWNSEPKLYWGDREDRLIYLACQALHDVLVELS